VARNKEGGINKRKEGNRKMQMGERRTTEM
jgi:hypothetical protein